LTDADLIKNLDHERHARELRGAGGKENSRDDNLQGPGSETLSRPARFNGCNAHD
jgi:hypothetical protein